MVEMMTSVTPFLRKAVRSQQSQMLGYARPRQVKRFGKRVYVFFSGTQFLDQPDAIRMSDDLEDLGQFFCNELTARHFISPFAQRAENHAL